MRIFSYSILVDCPIPVVGGKHDILGGSGIGCVGFAAVGQTAMEELVLTGSGDHTKGLCCVQAAILSIQISGILYTIHIIIAVYIECDCIPTGALDDVQDRKSVV